jgi:hypothetical protein
MFQKLISLLNKWIDICKKRKGRKDDLYNPAVYGVNFIAF